MARARNQRQEKRSGSESYGKMPGLILDFSNTDRKWQRGWVAVVSALSELETILDQIEIDVALDTELGIEISPNESQQLEQERTKLRKLEEKRDGMILDVLVEAPRSILNASAPKDIDWTKRESLDYIRGDRWADFVVGITVSSNGSVRANF